MFVGLRCVYFGKLVNERADGQVVEEGGGTIGRECRSGSAEDTHDVWAVLVQEFYTVETEGVTAGEHFRGREGHLTDGAGAELSQSLWVHSHCKYLQI